MCNLQNNDQSPRSSQKKSSEIRNVLYKPPRDSSAISTAQSRSRHFQICAPHQTFSTMLAGDTLGASTASMEFGLMNSLRTGHMMLDMVVCMLVPVLLKALLDAATNGHTALFEWFRKLFPATEVVRHIEYCDDWDDARDMEMNNTVLQRAISLYIAKKADRKLYGDALLCLTEKAQSKDQEQVEDEDDDDDYSPQRAKYKEMCGLELSAMPPFDTWVPIENGVEFTRVTIKEEDNTSQDEYSRRRYGVNKTITNKFSLRCSGPDAAEKIDDVVSKAYEEYKEQLRVDSVSKTRYMYVLHQIKEVNDQRRMPYKQYELSDEKTFDNMFFPQKQEMHSLLDNFVHKTGKFAIPGFPHKLGLLLHGPPGTGKTSIIKCLEAYMKRSIVSISLSKITTNQELMDAMFDLKFPTDQDSWFCKLQYKQIIFVLEDIDCASDIVNSREQKSRDSIDSQMVFLEANKEQKTSQMKEDEPMLMEMGPLDLDSSKKYKSLFSLKDKLNLAGIPNVLDGIVDTPNRIVVMTTNHLEKLDPTLVRPGRVSKKILLDYIAAESMMEMLKHYYAEEAVGNDIEDQISKLVTKESKVTPAEAEQLCAESDTVRDFIEELNALIHSKKLAAAPAC